MARKTTRTPRPPAAPAPAASQSVARTQPRRPSGSVPAVGGNVSTASRTEADYVEELRHVRGDLVRVVIIAVLMFGIIFISPYILPH